MILNPVAFNILLGFQLVTHRITHHVDADIYKSNNTKIQNSAKSSNL